MCNVVRAMPCIQRNHPVDSAHSMLLMAEGAGKIGIGHSAQQMVPALVYSLEERERSFNRGETRIGKLGPTLLIVWFDRRLILGECQFGTNVCIEVAVGHVVDHVSHRPSARPIR